MMSPFSFKRCDGQSYHIYACTRANHTRYPSVYVSVCGSSKHSLLEHTWEKTLTGRKCHIEQYHITFVRVVVFAVIICITE